MATAAIGKIRRNVFNIKNAQKNAHVLKSQPPRYAKCTRDEGTLANSCRKTGDDKLLPCTNKTTPNYGDGLQDHHDAERSGAFLKRMVHFLEIDASTVLRTWRLVTQIPVHSPFVHLILPKLSCYCAVKPKLIYIIFYNFIPSTLCTLNACLILKSSIISSEPPGIA